MRSPPNLNEGIGAPYLAALRHVGCALTVACGLRPAKTGSSRREPMAKQPRILAGETAAITGGARGIGRATAEALQRQGMRVAIGDVDAESARRTAEELGRSAVALPLDVTDREAFARFLDDAQPQLRPIEALLNNAATMQIRRV